MCDDRLEPVTRFATRYALHGGPKFSPDGRFVYFGSRDGWVSKYDIHNLRMVSEIRVGINMRNIAVSAEGRYIMAANYLPHTLVALDAATLQPLKVIPVADRAGKSSRVSAVYDAAPRGSFIAALKDLKEIWEIPYSDKAEPVYKGLVHDWRYKEGIAEKEAFPVRAIAVEDYLDDFFFDRGYDNLVGTSRDGKTAQVVNLHVKRGIERVALPGMPHLGSGITWDWQGRPVLATPNLRDGLVTVIDTKKEHIAVTEATKLGMPVVAVVDTNCDPDEVDYVIPGNDDALRAVRERHRDFAYPRMIVGERREMKHPGDALHARIQHFGVVDVGDADRQPAVALVL